MGCGSSTSAVAQRPTHAGLGTTNLRVGLNGPIQVASQPWAPKGAPAIYHGTVRPRMNFNATESAERLRDAMAGLGTKDDQLIQEITAVTNLQRQEIKIAYGQKYGRDLIQDIKSEISGDYEKTVLHLMKPSPEFDAWLLNETMAGLGTDEDILLEILCLRTKEQLMQIRQAYHQVYGKPVEEDIRGDTSGDFKKLLLALLEGNRDDPHIVIEAFARADARTMYEEGEGRLGTDDDKFIEIFTTRSWGQLAAATFMYEKLYNKPIEQMLNSEFSRDMLAALKKMVVFARCRASYFAERLYAAMKGLGTDDDSLQRIIISRCEVDLLEIKEAFRQMYGLPLSKMIRDDTSYKYQEVLLALIN
ncbi:annexin A4-like [Ptychodera flava]|uniref:annexin A4-like n=1 Tax=Ptychodera flava TaxID=63121 RepID=UPI00396A0561